MHKYHVLARALYYFGSTGVAIVLMALTAWLFSKFDFPPARQMLAYFGTISLELYLVNGFVRSTAQLTGIG